MRRQASIGPVNVAGEGAVDPEFVVVPTGAEAHGGGSVVRVRDVGAAGHEEAGAQPCPVFLLAGHRIRHIARAEPEGPRQRRDERDDGHPRDAAPGRCRVGPAVVRDEAARGLEAQERRVHDALQFMVINRASGHSDHFRCESHGRSCAATCRTWPMIVRNIRPPNGGSERGRENLPVGPVRVDGHTFAY